MADEPLEMPGSSGDEENATAHIELWESEDETAARIRTQWHLHLMSLDIILNPTLSIQAAMSAVSRIVRFATHKRPRPRLSQTSINRFFSDEYLDRIQAREARDRARWKRYKNFGCSILMILIIVFIIGLIMLIVYCYLDPTSPQLEVVTVEFNYNVMTDVDASVIQAQQAAGKGDYFAAIYNFSITYTVEFRNPNDKVDLFVQHLELRPYYFGFQLGHGSASPFKQPRHSSSLVRINTVENALHVPLRENYSIKRDMALQSIDFVVEMKLNARMSTIGELKSPSFRASVNCDITLSYSAPPVLRC